MKSLPLPDDQSARNDLRIGPAQYVERGINRGKALSNEEIETVLQLYQDYDAADGQAVAYQNAGNLSDALSDAVRHAYKKTYEGRTIYHLRTALLDPDALCPICGINFCEELDHFLPKSDFGLFAIYARNLIPTCSACNELKRTNAGGVPASQFVHAYFENIPDTEFLRAEVRLEGSALNVEFGVNPGVGLSEELSERLSFQFETLKLNERYRKELNLYLQSLSANWWHLFELAGVIGFRQSLQRQAQHEAAVRHINDWRACLCRALANHDEFCDGGFRRVYPNTIANIVNRIGDEG